MRKSFYILFPLFCLSTSLQAQKDSSTTRSVLGLQETGLYQLYKQQAAAIIINPVQQYGIASVVFSQKTGDYRRVQEGGTSTVAAFESEGLKRLGNIWVQGNFTYKRQWDDSVHNSLRRDVNDPSPYYLWTPRTGNMNQEIYHLDGQMAANIANGKLVLGAGANYDASNDYRTIDPRPYIDYFNFSVKGTIAYKPSKTQLITIEPLIGYGKENTTAYSKNQDSASAANYQIYRAEGLVEVSSGAESQKKLTQWRNYNGVSIGYYLNTKTLGNWMISYKYTETEEKSFNRFYNPTSQLDYGKVNYYDHVVTASWYRKFQHKLASFSWVSHINKAKDFNYYLDGANYTSFTVNHEAAAGISFEKNGKPVHEFVATFRYNEREQKDGNHLSKSHYAQNTYDLKYRLNLFMKTSMVQITVHGAITQNQNSYLQLPSSEFDYLFVPAIVYPDAEFFTTDNWQSGLKVAYNNISTKTVRWGISAGVEYVKNSNQGLYFAQSGFHPGTDRTCFSAGVHFFL